MNKIPKILKDIAKADKELYSKICIVRKVVDYAMIIDVEPIDSLNYKKETPNPNNYIKNVRLTPMIAVIGKAGSYKRPALNTYVIVTFISREIAYVSMLGETDYFTLAAKDVKMTLNESNFFVENPDIFNVIDILNITDTTTDYSEINIAKIDKLRLETKSGDNYLYITPDNISFKTKDDKISIFQPNLLDIVEVRDQINIKTKQFVDISTWGMYYFYYYWNEYPIGISIKEIFELSTNQEFFGYSDLKNSIYNNILLDFIVEAFTFFTLFNVTAELKNFMVTDLLSDRYATTDIFITYQVFRKDAFDKGYNVSKYPENIKYKLDELVYANGLEYIYNLMVIKPAIIPVANNGELVGDSLTFVKTQFDKYDLTFYNDFMNSMGFIGLFLVDGLEMKLSTELLESLDIQFKTYFEDIYNDIETNYGVDKSRIDILDTKIANQISTTFLPSVILGSKSSILQTIKYLSDVSNIAFSVYKYAMTLIYNPEEEISSKNESLFDILTDLNNAIKSLNGPVSIPAIPYTGTFSINPLMQSKLDLNYTNNINVILK